LGGRHEKLKTVLAEDSISKSFVIGREAEGRAVARQGVATTTRMIWK
jgi:hypothetical protein